MYTPSVLEGGGIYMANLTIPPGHFYSDVMISPGKMHANSIDVKPATLGCMVSAVSLRHLLSRALGVLHTKY